MMRGEVAAPEDVWGLSFHWVCFAGFRIEGRCIVSLLSLSGSRLGISRRI